MDERRRGFDLVPMIALAVIVALLVGGVLLFPRVQAALSRQDCIAAGHTNC